jgi:hypothetical protein
MGRAPGTCTRVGPTRISARRRAAAGAGAARVPDRAVVESSGGSWMECGSAASRAPCFTGLGRLGRTARAGSCLAPDRRSVLGQPGGRVVGHPQDRRAGGTAGTILGRAAGAASRLGHAFPAGAGVAHAACPSPAPTEERGSGALVVRIAFGRGSGPTVVDRRRPGGGCAGRPGAACRPSATSADLEARSV